MCSSDLVRIGAQDAPQDPAALRPVQARDRDCQDPQMPVRIWFWIAVGYGMIASVVYFVALLLDERWRNRRLAEGRFEEYDIW